MLSSYLARARAGEALWLPELREDFAALPDAQPLLLRLTLPDGDRRDFRLSIPVWATPEEQAFLASLGPETSDAWQRAFTRLWTRKESFLKSTGEGLSRPLAAFSVLDGTSGLTFAHAAPDPAYDFCCCLPGEEGQVSWRRTVFEE